MPKPTTHTDIVVVTKQDPQNPGPIAGESVQLMLVSEAAAMGTVYAKKADCAEAQGMSVGSSPVILVMDVNGNELQIGYELTARLGQPAGPITGALTNEPWGDDNGGPAFQKIGGTYRWATPNSEAFITQLDLIIHGKTNSGGSFSHSVVHSTTNGMKHATVVVSLDSRPVGTLYLTASMEALPV